jgi:hypothetical protein
MTPSMPRMSIHVLYTVVIAILALTLAGHSNGAPSTQESARSYIAYHGTLRGPDGKLLPNGAYKLTFRIYDSPAAGNQLWEEPHDGVTVRDGQFSVLLGDITSLSPDIFRRPNTYIGITLDGHEEMTPRQRFASVPYAISANFAQSAGKADTASHADAASRLSGATPIIVQRYSLKTNSLHMTDTGVPVAEYICTTASHDSPFTPLGGSSIFPNPKVNNNWWFRVNFNYDSLEGIPGVIDVICFRKDMVDYQQLQAPK